MKNTDLHEQAYQRTEIQSLLTHPDKFRYYTLYTGLSPGQARRRLLTQLAAVEGTPNPNTRRWESLTHYTDPPCTVQETKGTTHEGEVVTDTNTASASTGTGAAGASETDKDAMNIDS